MTDLKRPVRRRTIGLHRWRAYRTGRLKRALSELGYTVGWLWYRARRRMTRRDWITVGWCAFWLAFTVVVLAIDRLARG